MRDADDKSFPFCPVSGMSDEGRCVWICPSSDIPPAWRRSPSAPAASKSDLEDSLGPGVMVCYMALQHHLSSLRCGQQWFLRAATGSKLIAYQFISFDSTSKTDIESHISRFFSFSNTYSQCSRTVLCKLYVQHIGGLSRATCRVPRGTQGLLTYYV